MSKRTQKKNSRIENLHLLLLQAVNIDEEQMPAQKIKL